MNLQNILCPIDFSEYNLAANLYASTLAGSTGARMIYLHAYLPDAYEPPTGSFDATKFEKELVEKMEQFIKPVGDGIAVSYVVEFGLPTERIVNYAHENSVDLIVVGTHGRTGLRRVLMGSVAEAVVRNARCPVLAIKVEANVPQET